MSRGVGPRRGDSAAETPGARSTGPPRARVPMCENRVRHPGEHRLPGAGHHLPLGPCLLSN